MAKAGSWPECGVIAAEGGAASAVWGECKGSGAKPYLAAAHLDGDKGPAYKCSCPSRKIPCKHVLALLALWSQGTVADREDRPEWVATWLAGRVARQERASGAAAPAPVDPEKAAATLRARERSVTAGLEELRLWLHDQVDGGLAEVPKLGYDHWDRMAKRLVDAKAGGAASLVTQLPQTGGRGGGENGDRWPDRLLERLGMLHLLVDGYLAVAAAESDPGPADAQDATGSSGDTLARTRLRSRAVLRARVGISTRTEEVLAEGERVRDTWRVLGHRDSLTPDGMRSRRQWLRGSATGRYALSLTFARPTQTPDSPFRTGTEADGELAFHPDGRRAVRTGSMTERPAPPPPGGTVDQALDSYAEALAEDPWLEAWPVVLENAVPARSDGWHLADPTGASLPMDSAELWRLLAVTGGRPATVAAEWSPATGLTPMTVWDADGKAVTL
ncbi:SWIM zinc finger domain-containing protein [Nocardiopsis exhalans]|uniref:SWIM zinc finger domain-containing protein n=1 Tax=Nocardiopsis exhalans TaxID=163604 RepID=A0ABY5DI75_9ACTN|nr:SWIM zinc finger family protein [Nocardiopsis exhalans]USY23125.1 SWIM zinc finger domain-containing protein [Nocardiopsis exhalans]